MFSGSDVTQVMGVSDQAASVMLHRWKQADLVRPLGGRSDVFFNLLVQHEWMKNFQYAIRRAMPFARLVGPEAWRVRGWTTQIQYQLDVVIPTKADSYAIEGLRVHRRGVRWSRAVAHGQVAPMRGRLIALTPSYALADALLAQAAAARSGEMAEPAPWAPDPDDLYADTASRSDIREFRAAVKSLAAAYAIEPPSLEREAVSLTKLYEQAWLGLRSHDLTESCNSTVTSPRVPPGS